LDQAAPSPCHLFPFQDDNSKQSICVKIEVSQAGDFAAFLLQGKATQGWEGGSGWHRFQMASPTVSSLQYLSSKREVLSSNLKTTQKMIIILDLEICKDSTESHYALPPGFPNTHTNMTVVHLWRLSH
jgi:hypothetical protein